MSKEELNACFTKMDLEKFIKDPTTTLLEAGARFKPGITFKFVETEAEINKLPENVVPIQMPNKIRYELSTAELDRVVGGLSNGATDVIGGMVGTLVETAIEHDLWGVRTEITSWFNW
jgi:hypothetical protein